MKIQLVRKLDGMLEQYIKQWFTAGILQSLFIKYGVATVHPDRVLLESLYYL